MLPPPHPSHHLRVPRPAIQMPTPHPPPTTPTSGFPARHFKVDCTHLQPTPVRRLWPSTRTILIMMTIMNWRKGRSTRWSRKVTMRRKAWRKMKQSRCAMIHKMLRWQTLRPLDRTKTPSHHQAPCPTQVIAVNLSCQSRLRPLYTARVVPQSRSESLVPRCPSLGLSRTTPIPRRRKPLLHQQVAPTVVQPQHPSGDERMMDKPSVMPVVFTPRQETSQDHPG